MNRDGTLNPIDQNLDLYDEEEEIHASPIDKNSQLKQSADKVLTTGDFFGNLQFLSIENSVI